MPSPKDIKNLLKATQGTKAGKAADLEELLATLPKGTKAQQLEAELMFKRLAEEQAARYAAHTPPTEQGNAALSEAKKALKKKQAPAVIIPSKISNVQKAIRESKGSFGAKRVQRAADEIKNLERLYTEEALKKAFGGDNAKALMTMNPEDFERFAIPLVMQEKGWPGSGPRKETLPTREYINYLSGIDEFHDVPFLEINKQRQGLPLIPFVSGHEGRHRNRALAQRDEPAGLVQFLPRAELREPFPRRDQEEYLEALRNELEMTGNMVLPERYLEDGDVYIKRPEIKLPDIYAEGGGVHMAGGGKALKALKGAGKAADATQDVQSIVSAGKPLTAAERAMVGKLAEEYTANQPVTRLSEALGNVGAEGKNLRVTQTDRTSARNLGGAPFSMMQKVDPRYAQAKATWGVKTPGAAKNITNQSDADVIWSTLIGSKTQHRSNELIFDKLYKAFQKSAKEGNLSTELRTKFNAALEPIFGEGADILDPKLRKEIDTFEKRAIVGNLLLGKDIGGAQRGGSIIPGMKIMAETTEPMLKNAETFSIGPRLFTLDQGVITRPDLHPAFPEILTGEDLNQLFIPVPNRIALPTFNEEFRARTGRKKPSYYDLTMTPEGDPYPTQFVDEDYLNFLQKEGYADGGAVHMAGGGDAGEVSGDMFKPKPLTIPSPLTDMVDAIRRQFGKEKRSMSKPGAATDVLLRGPVAFAAGTPMDLVEMAGQGIDYLQTRIPGLRTNASVMDEPRSVVDKRTPDTNYEPRFKFAPEPKVQPSLPFDASRYIQTSDPKLRAFINKRQKEINSGLQLPIVEEARMPYGTEDFQNKLRQSGLTTDEERPLFEIGTAIASPFAAQKALKYGKAGAQALAPTFSDILETQLQNVTAPMRMSIVPEGGTVGGKLKAPANDIGFYNPVEKAALNVQRKKGPGSAFVSDLKKQPGVNDERLAELGLSDLASRPNVTREEVLAAAQQNRIPLRETVLKEGKESLEELSDNIYQLKDDMSYMDNDSREWAEADRTLTRLQKEYEAESQAKRAMFGPKTHADYNMPGGQNYREIRVALPAVEKPQYFIAYKDGSTMGTGFASKADAEAELADLFGSRPDLEIRQGSGSRSMTAKNEENFMNSTHHGDEPNVLFHLRVADHTDVEGKKGLLIDELQSDWHQQGREKGYKQNAEKDYNSYFESLGDRFIAEQKQQNIKAGMTPTDAEYYATEMYSSLAQREGHRGIARALGEEDKLVELSNQYKRDINALPDAPFKDNWYQLGLKRAIKEAADSGKERVYLTTGQRQADRYDLSKQVNQIDVVPRTDAATGEQTKSIGLNLTNGDFYRLGVDKNGIVDNVSNQSISNLKGKPLAEVVGKDVAKKILEENAQVLSGLDLKVGGEGMRQYYDKNYLNFLKKYAKQFGATVGETTLPGAAKTRNQLSASDMHNMMDNPEFKKILDEEFMKLADKPLITGKIEPQGNNEFKIMWSDGSFSGGYSAEGARERLAVGRNLKNEEGQAWNAALKRFGGEKVYYIDITPKMRESAAKGQSYKDGGAVAMAEGGQLTFAKANQLLQQYVANMANDGAVHMAEGGAVDYESRFNEMLQKHVQGMAEGGEVNTYDSDPDMSDGGRFIQAPAFADGGAVKSIWTVN